MREIEESLVGLTCQLFSKSSTAGAIDKKGTWDLVQPIETIKPNKMDLVRSILPDSLAGTIVQIREIVKPLKCDAALLHFKSRMLTLKSKS